MTGTEANTNTQQVPFDELVSYLNELVTAFENHPDEATRQAVFELLQGIDAMHREAFKRLAAFLEDHQAGALLGEAAQADRLIGTVLTLYDVLPDQAALAQVEQAINRVRPYVESHGGWVRVLAVEGGIVHLEMGGACHGCPGSTFTLRRGIEIALRKNFPGFEEIVAHEPPAGSTGPNGHGAAAPEVILQTPVFQTAGRLEDVQPGEMKPVTLGSIRTLLANVAGEIYAVGELCPGSALPLSVGRLEGAAVVCPWHNERFDVRTGECLAAAGRRDEPRLAVYPVALVDGEIRIAVNVSARPALAEAQNG